MKLIVALGNPGRDYVKTRHNAGFMALDRLLRRLCLDDQPARSRFNAAVIEGAIDGHKCLLIRPATYMNRSGNSVQQAVAYYKIDPAQDLLVLVDDIALPCGDIRLRAQGGPGGHNGLSDIRRALATDNYPRCRIGIDPKPPFIDDQANYVLGRFTDEQLARLEPALDRACDATTTFVKEGIETAMNRHNSRPTPPAPPASDNGRDGQPKQNDTPPTSPGTHPGWFAG